MFEKTLSDLVKGLRSNKRREAEFVSKCIAEIKVRPQPSCRVAARHLPPGELAGGLRSLSTTAYFVPRANPLFQCAGGRVKSRCCPPYDRVLAIVRSADPCPVSAILCLNRRFSCHLCASFCLPCSQLLHLSLMTAAHAAPNQIAPPSSASDELVRLSEGTCLNRMSWREATKVIRSRRRRF